MFSRRDLLRLAGTGLAAMATPRLALADVATDTPLHGLSAFGELKYPKGFEAFDYVNRDAPKGGLFVFSPRTWVLNQSPQTYNTLNTFSAKGDAPPRMELCFDMLMVSALDEPDSIYGLLAESVTVSRDKRTYSFALRPEARFHDGSPVTAHDVVFSFETIVKFGHPSILLLMTQIENAVAEDDHRFRFSVKGDNPGLTALTAIPLVPVLSKNWYSTRDFEASTLEPPLGSGPYRVSKVAAGNRIEYQRVEDYWAKDLAVRRGQNNFERIRIDFYRDRQPEFEAFKKGDIYWRTESTAKTWATEYDFPAIQQKKVVKRTFPSEKRPTMQAWAINQRREHFRDPRVREAISLCFDFEWTRKNLFYGSYEKSHSLFERSDFRAEGLPSPQELAIMEPLRSRLPTEIFGEAVLQPSSDGSGRDRKNLRRASELLAEAGFKRDGTTLADARGNPLKLEMLIAAEVFVRVYSPFINNLKAIGINAGLRMIDPAQYQLRLQDFDFDMIGIAFAFSPTPSSDSLATMFGSRAASVPGSYNLCGVADPVLDELIAKVSAARSREELNTIMRVLDRLLRVRRDWIPNWFLANHQVAYWDMFGFKEPKPDYDFLPESLWWFDEEKARSIGKS
ncbi:extracellular solute-binding protein [Phyllobacterium sp. 21LDTY02-6]|uniref:extracellular solute-binding protein n=1 Tax=Phyllobacterium sp. 21LDTY02-6 TaxID=2944903 RepID=UPI002020DA99|nr:extracellular solute-binding protein [Phyllobacterium sp. 21LDTY02-6]MCO4316854.1 extracellular solute-binding protein [Phyllobacterium sp. 21LDTY02-6]